MNVRANARASAAIARAQQDVPVLRSSEVGDERFISFISFQAGMPQRASLVVQELERHCQRGYRLDAVLSQILRQARATVKRSRKQVRPAFC